MRAAIRNTPSHNFLTILGDFNARLGPEEARFPFHTTTNRNGRFLAELLAEHDLLAVNACFNKRMGKRWTFCDRGTQTKRQLDYILARRKWRDSILNAEAYNSLEALGSDHRLVTAKIRLSLRMPKQKTKRVSFDWRQLTSNPDLQEKYSIEVRNRFAPLASDTEDPTEAYQLFIDANAAAAKAFIPCKPKRTKICLSSHLNVLKAREEIDKILEQRTSLGPDDHELWVESLEHARRALYNTYDCLKAYDIDKKARKVDLANNSRQYNTAWEVINEISGRKINSECGRIPGNSAEEQISTWFSHFKNLLGNAPAVDDVDDNYLAEDVILSGLDIYDDPFTIDDLASAKSSLRSGKSTGPDKIPPEVLKACDLDDIVLEFCNQALMNKSREISRWDLHPDAPRSHGCQLAEPYA